MYWLLGSSTMHCGPEPAGYGEPMMGCSSWLVALMVNADSELKGVVVWVLVVELFATYRYLPVLSISVYTGSEVLGKSEARLTIPPLRDVRLHDPVVSSLNRALV